MMRNNPRRMVLRGVAVGGMSLLVAGFVAPGAVASGNVDGDVKINNTETVEVLMNASGKISAKRVYEQLVLTGNGKVDIANPVSTDGLRNLDGFGHFDVRDGKVRIKTDVDGTRKYRSVSNFTKKLPLDVSVKYVFNGKDVKPGDVVGKSGDLEVKYRVTNNTGVVQDVPFKDGDGNTKTASESVVIPMIGSLTTTLPSTFTKVHSAEASAGGDGRGGTQLSFNMTLFPPIGANFAEFGYTAHIKDGVIPKATISALPVDPLQSPSFKGGAASYKGGADKGVDLTAGATQVDANLLKLRDGASDLVTGILKLQTGASQLNSGAGTLAAGTGKLNKGANDLHSGASQIEDGADALNDGLKSAKSKAPALLDGIDQLTAGAKLVDAGLVKLQGAVDAGVGSPAKADTLRNGVAQIQGGLNSLVLPGLAGITSGALDPALAVAGNVADSTQKAQLTALISGAKSGIDDVVDGINAQILPGLATLDGGLQLLNSQVAAGVGTPESKDTLRNGVAQLIGGLGQMKTQGGTLIDGLGQLSAGAGQLEVGTDQLSSGAGDLASGTGELNTGAGELVTGTGQLADGLNQAADGAPALPEGATKLSKEGTSQLVKAGDETASDFGLKYAVIEAGAKRAGSAQPYGSPEGATSLTAYQFELAGADGAGSANVKRGLAAIALLAIAAGAATVRRRFAG